MALNIKSKETESVVRRLAAVTGESLTEAIHKAAEERLAKLDAHRAREREERVRRLRALIQQVQTMPILDDRPEDELLGYNENGLFD